jgi:hypothetical protein
MNSMLQFFNAVRLEIVVQVATCLLARESRFIPEKHFFKFELIKKKLEYAPVLQS